MAVSVLINHFRFGWDDGATESTYSFITTEDTIPSHSWGGNTFLLRFNLQESGGTAIANVDEQFRYNKNDAGWVNITTSTSTIKAVAAGSFLDQAVTSRRLSGTGTFEVGNQCTEDGLTGGGTVDIGASGSTETVCAIQVIMADVSNGDRIDFDLTSPDTTLRKTISAYITVVKSASVYPSGPIGRGMGSGIWR